MEEIRKQQQHQDKIAGYLAIPVILLIVAVFKFSGHANLGSALFAGLLGAGAAVSGYYLWVNREDKESKRIYGFFYNHSDRHIFSQYVLSWFLTDSGNNIDRKQVSSHVW